MNHDKNSISMNIDIRKNKFFAFFLFSIFFVPVLPSQKKKGRLKKKSKGLLRF